MAKAKATPRRATGALKLEPRTFTKATPAKAPESRPPKLTDAFRSCVIFGMKGDKWANFRGTR